MKNLTVRELVEKAKCRVGNPTGRDAGCKFWRPFGAVRIKRNTFNDGRDIASTCSFEIRHFDNDDMSVVVKFSDWMDSKYSKEWDIPEILNLTNSEDVAHRLRKGVRFCEDESDAPVYYVPIDNDGWENLLEELESLGLPEKFKEQGPDENEKIAA